MLSRFVAGFQIVSSGMTSSCECHSGGNFLTVTTEFYRSKITKHEHSSKKALANVEQIIEEWIETAKSLKSLTPKPKGKLLFA